MGFRNGVKICGDAFTMDFKHAVGGMMAQYTPMTTRLWDAPSCRFKCNVVLLCHTALSEACVSPKCVVPGDWVCGQGVLQQKLCADGLSMVAFSKEVAELSNWFRYWKTTRTRHSPIPLYPIQQSTLDVARKTLVFKQGASWACVPQTLVDICIFDAS